MYKENKMFLSLLVVCVAVVLTMMTGCTSTIPVTTTMPGEFNLPGVSKIALIDFNSMPNDPLLGIYAADKETASLVKQMIAKKFCDVKHYQITDLDIEKEIAEKHSVKLASRFDAVIYGRVWWQISPEYRGTYPEIVALTAGQKVAYQVRLQDKKGNVTVENRVQNVTTKREEVIAAKYYRAWNANLMLSITCYRVNKDGQFEKLIDTYTVASRSFIVDDGNFKTAFDKITPDKVSRAEFLKALTEDKTIEQTKEEVESATRIQNADKIPTDLHTKLVLVDNLASQLSEKMTPTHFVLQIPNDFSDAIVEGLFDKKAYRAVKNFAAATLKENVGEEIANEILGWPEYDPKRELPDELTDAVGDNRNLLFAMAVASEALGQNEEALAIYRYIFNIVPDEELAVGISRCLFALNMNARVREAARTKKAAEKKTRLQ